MSDHQSIHWIDTQESLDALTGHVQQQAVVGIDTEFHGERSYTAHLMLIQLATSEGIWLVDPLADLRIEGLLNAVGSPDRVTVGHALHNDLEIFCLRHGIVMDNVFDTQVAASFLGYGLQIGLVGLIQQLFSERLPKGAQMADWSRRPLPKSQREYAANDVAYLLSAHEALSEDLRRLGRIEWVHEECRSLSDRGRYGRDPRQVYRRVSGFGRLRPREMAVLVELAAVRERLASTLDLVPHFFLSDDIMLSLARKMPRSAGDLKGDRRLGHRNISKYIDDWLQAVASGLQSKPPATPRRAPITPGMEATAGLLMMVVNEIAEREQLAPQLLTKRKALLSALQCGFDDEDELCHQLELHGWRRQLLGNVLWRMLHGDIQIQCRRSDSGYNVHLSID